MIDTYDTSRSTASLAREPARSFPFLTDGEEVYLVEGWKAEARPRKQLSVRRLGRAERALVERSLREAAEEVAYRIPSAKRPLSDRTRRARPARS